MFRKILVLALRHLLRHSFDEMTGAPSFLGRVCVLGGKKQSFQDKTMPRVPRTRQPRMNAPRSEMPRSRDERDSSPVRMPEGEQVHFLGELIEIKGEEDNLTDVSIDSFSSDINLIVDSEREKIQVSTFNDAISYWLGQEYVMRPTLNHNPQSRLDWDRWAAPIAKFVKIHFPDEAHNNPTGMQFPYCGVVAYFVTQCVGGVDEALDYLACLLHRVLSTSTRHSLPMDELLVDLYPYMLNQGLVEHPFFQTLNWAHRVGYEFVMWERHNFVLHTTLGAFSTNPTYPLPDATIFERVPGYVHRARGPLRMQAPPYNGPLVPAPEPSKAQLASLKARRARKTSVALTRKRREIHLPTRYKV